MPHEKTSPKKPLFSWRMILSQSISFMRDTPSAWIFGCILSLPLFLIVAFESFSKNLDEADITRLAPIMMLAMFFMLFSFFAGESGLILSFKNTERSPLEYLAAIGALIRWYFFFFLMILILFAIFFSPLFFAPEETRGVLKYIGVLFFCFTASIAFILKMFGGFYLLLGKLSLENALRSSAAIFTDHLISSGIAFLSMTLFSFSSSTIISIFHSLLTFPLQDTLIRNTPLVLVIGTLTIVTNVFFRVFWYFFFQAIATERPSDWQKEKKVVQENMVPIEDEA
jgi:hypothetical protein